MRHLICLVALFPAAAAAQEHTLKVPTQTAAGDRIQVTTHRTAKGGTTVTVGDTVVNQEKRDEVTLLVSVQSIQTREKGKKPARFSVAIEKAEWTNGGKKIDVGLNGKSATVAMSGGKPTVKFADGTGPTGEAAAFLNDQFKHNSENEEQIEKALFLDRPVKVGETWEGNLDELARQLADAGIPVTFDARASKATCKLLKVYEKAGRTFGVVDVDLKLVLKTIGPEGQTIKLDTGSFFGVVGKLDVAIDGGKEFGSHDLTITMKANGKAASADGREFVVKVDNTGIEKESIVPLPAK